MEKNTSSKSSWHSYNNGLQKRYGCLQEEHLSSSLWHNRTHTPVDMLVSLWTERNTLLFEDRHISYEEIATKGIRLAREWGLAQRPKEKGSKPLPGSVLHKAGQHADPQTPICRSDATWDKSSNKAGLAWIISEAQNDIKNKDQPPRSSSYHRSSQKP